MQPAYKVDDALKVITTHVRCYNIISTYTVELSKVRTLYFVKKKTN